MRKMFLFSVILMFGLATKAQTVTLTFTGRENCGDCYMGGDDKEIYSRYVQLDHVVITNLTQNWTETIYWPDTVLTITNVTGIDEHTNKGGFGLSQNNPNPFNGTTDVMLSVENEGSVIMDITDLNGRVIATQYFASLPAGFHQFRVSVSASGTYVMTARQNGHASSIKMVNNSSEPKTEIEYRGTTQANDYSLKSGIRGETTRPISSGDELECVGYCHLGNYEMESEHIDFGIYADPDFDPEEYDLSFSFSLEGIPAPSPVSCPNPLTITDVDGNTYHTVQIGNQCWMKENLRTTKYADGTSIAQGSMYDSGSAYWYYPNGESSYKPTHGLLYNREAVMRNSNPSNANPSGVQGICPAGWHVPSYAEWMQLIDYVRSQRWYVCECCPNNIGKALSSIWGWDNWNHSVLDDNSCQVGYTQSNNNATGFSALPAGYFLAYYFGGTQYYRYEQIGQSTTFWTTATNNTPYSSQVSTGYASSSFGASSSAPVSGCSVRCLKD